MLRKRGGTVSHLFTRENIKVRSVSAGVGSMGLNETGILFADILRTHYDVINAEM